jgi:hypothetical protein
MPFHSDSGPGALPRATVSHPFGLKTLARGRHPAHFSANHTFSQ